MTVIIAGYLELWYFVLCLVIFLQCRYFIFYVDILHNFFVYYVLYLVSICIACSLLCGIKEVVCCFRQHDTVVVLLHAYGLGL